MGLVSSIHDVRTSDRWAEVTYAPSKEFFRNRWMQELSHILAEKRLFDIRIPGTHNSASYSCVDRVARCQDSDLNRQFIIGVRYFDLRAGWEFPMRPGGVRVGHGISWGMSWENCFWDLGTMLKRYPKEFIIISCGKAAFLEDKDKTFVRSSIIDRLGQWMVKEGDFADLSKVTMKELWEKDKRVLVLFEDWYCISEISKEEGKKLGIFPKELYSYGDYANTTNNAKMYAHADHLVDTADPKMLLEISLTLTPEKTQAILEGVKELTGDLMGEYGNLYWCKSKIENDKRFNIILMDFIFGINECCCSKQLELVDLIIRSNAKKPTGTDEDPGKFFKNKEGMMSYQSVVDMGQGPGAVAWLVGDFNGDKKDEIVQAWSNNGRLGMIMYGMNDTGKLSMLWSNSDMGQGSGAVQWLVGDFNGDKKDEIVQAWSNNGRLGMIMYGMNDTGKLSMLWSNSDMGQGSGAVQWLVGDFNGDKKDEIVQAWSNNGRLGMIMYGMNDTGKLSMLWSNSDMGQGSGAVRWLVGDFNGDKKDEIVQAWSNNGRLGMIMYGMNDTGKLSMLWSNSDMGQGSGAVQWLVGDFNGDKKDEIVQAWSNNGQLGLIAYGMDYPSAHSFKLLWSTSDTGLGSGAVAWLVGDFTGNGKDEIVQLWEHGSALGLIKYGTDESSSYRFDLLWDTENMGQGPGAVAWLVGDFNGDGKDEIIQNWDNNSALAMILYASPSCH